MRLNDKQMAQVEFNRGHQAGIEEGRRKVVVELVEGKCPHTGSLDEEQLNKIDCPKCWLSLRREVGLN